MSAWIDPLRYETGVAAGLHRLARSGAYRCAAAPEAVHQVKLSESTFS